MEVPQSRKTRKPLIDALLTALDPYEWRELRDRLNKRNYQYDIIGSFPLELVILVFKYLDVGAPYRLQVVSKRWRESLRSLDLIKPIVSRWYLKGDPPLQGEADAHDEYDVWRLRAENGYRFMAAYPSSKALYSTTCKAGTGYSDKVVAFSQDRVAWICMHVSGGTDIVIFNLGTGTTTRYRGEAREQFWSITLSSQLLAGLTPSGRCYVWDVTSGVRRSFRIGSIIHQRLTDRDRTIALINPSGREDIDITLYDFDKDTTHSLKIKKNLINNALGTHSLYNRSAFLQDIVVDPTNSQLIVFVLRAQCNLGEPIGWYQERHEIFAFRFSFQGIWDKALVSVLIRTSPILGTKPIIVRRTNHNGVWAIPLYDMDVFYDEASHTFQDWTVWEKLCDHDVDYADFPTAFKWKDVVYALDILHGQKNPEGCRLISIQYPLYKEYLSHLDTDREKSYDICKEIPIHSVEIPRNGNAWNEERTATSPTGPGRATEVRRGCRLLGNDRYIVLFFAGSVAVWCFDRNAPLPQVQPQ